MCKMPEIFYLVMKWDGNTTLFYMTLLLVSSTKWSNWSAGIHSSHLLTVEVFKQIKSLMHPDATLALVLPTCY